ncbi:thioeseterase [Maritimibacter sp. 55A14]|uniref:acyl-CoA thioesterase n=1 Tax=Maritimibacter sp. 55A14 TaxID=2174844 RepID=UPI000D60C14E|nr:acyl-CoA thioesterase [Maritimibacter sp. 55A14]PWE30049.1 thioeseterase [Maritimibacter sp. 55A14]
MYPIVRMVKELAVQSRKPRLPFLGTHVSHHICWPWDLDIWLELNNGRSLTLYDLGRIPLGLRVGLVPVMRRNRWALTMAGVSVRWRRRTRVFDKVEIHSRCVGWDDRFLYIEQSMWHRGQANSAALYRAAVTDRNGLLPTAKVLAAMGAEAASPELPAHVRAWIEADATRPWPPET